MRGRQKRGGEKERKNWKDETVWNRLPGGREIASTRGSSGRETMVVIIEFPRK